MIRQLVAATTDPANIHPGLADHQADMIRRCPYLGPSVERGLTVWSSYSTDSKDDRPALFTMLVENAEVLREDRRKHGSLVCRNIALIGPGDIDEASALMWWPAWLARNLYAPVQMIYRTFDDHTGTCEIGGWLTPEAEGRGFITLAFRQLIDWASPRGMHRIELRASPKNTRAIAIAQRLGMTHEATLRSAFILNGVSYDSEVWAILPMPTRTVE